MLEVQKKGSKPAQKRYIYELSSSGVDGFVANEQWLRQQVRTGRICRKCKWLRLDRVDELEAIYVVRTYSQTHWEVLLPNPPPIHVGSVSGLAAGVVLSNQLLKLLGGANDQHYTLPVMDYTGHRYSFTCLIEKQQSWSVRGSFKLPPWICPVCDRLMYFPSDEKQVIDLYWPAKTRFKVGGSNVFADAAIYERKIKPKRLSRLRSKRVRLVAQSNDGYPADFDAMFQAILDEDA
jgi:hypothetical protein